jgi:predicted methyltransferase
MGWMGTRATITIITTVVVSLVVSAPAFPGPQERRPIPPAPPAFPGRPVPPGIRGAAPPSPPRSKNRLFAPQDLGLIEPPDRDRWQPPETIMDALNIAEGDTVADLGAGGGWFTIYLARRVAPKGVVYAVDVQQPMLEAIRRRAQRENVSAIIRPILGTTTDPMLPGGIDVAIIINAYHEIACAAKPTCEEPVALLKNVARSLKPQGRLGVVDFNPGEGGPGPAQDERIDPESVINAASAAGLQLISRTSVAPFNFQFLLIFGKVPVTRGSQ